MERLVVVVALVLSGGCRTQLLDPSREAGFPDAAASDGDGAIGSDATVPSSCGAHALEPVALAALTLVDGPPPYMRDQTVRVRARVPLRAGCDVLGHLTVQTQVGNATDGITLTAYVWHGSAGCGAATVIDRFLPISSNNQRVFVRDGVGSATLTWQITEWTGAAPSCAETPVREALCQIDCQCQGTDLRLRCIRSTTPNGPPFQKYMGRCLESCSEDVDCPADRVCLLVPPPPSFPPSICRSVADRNDCGQGCPFGQVCDGYRCLPSPRPLGGSCTCDADCGAGRVCTDQHACVIPCTTVADCPVGNSLCAGACDSTK